MIETLSDKTAEILNYIPFVSLVVSNKPSPMSTKLVEMAIMAAISAGFSIYLAVPIIQKDIEVLNVNVKEVDKKVETVDLKVEKIRSDLYRPVGGK